MERRQRGLAIAHPRATVAALALTAGLILSITAPVAAQPAPPRSAAAAPALPSGLHLGVGSLPWDMPWMVDSGVPWRYRNAFLEGGVNTGQGWEIYGSNGQWVTDYMRDSDAFGAIPVFSYYELCQSNGLGRRDMCNYDPPNVTNLIYTNLNDVNTMQAYYANFKFALQRMRDFGKPVIMHVEVDSWGLLEMRAAGGPASSISAAVSSTGTADLAGIPNTLQGFAWALLHLRDLYATNAIMATHPSHFAGPGGTVTTSLSPSFDTIANAGLIASFMNGAGITFNPFGSTWDLAFIDVDDHDAAWWELSGLNPPDETHWWNPTGSTVPNGSRYLTWVAEMRRLTGLPYFLWQIPLGNQYFLTMNNTGGHFQDNRADWLINNADQVAAAGVVGMLFSVGNGGTEGQTSNVDAMLDGITNNNGVPTSGYMCDACNNNVATVPDDDGGFLRLLGARFYNTAPPGPPTSARAVGGSQSAIVSWTAPRNDRGSPITSYKVTGTPGGSATMVCPCPSLSAVVPGLVDGTSYTFTVSATNAKGTGPASTPSSPVTPQPAQCSQLASSGSGPSRGPVAAWAPGRLDIFERSSTNTLWHGYHMPPWGGPESQPGPPGGLVAGSDPVAVSWAPGRLDVFAIAGDGNLYHKWWPGPGGLWSGWESQGNPGSALTGQPAAVAWSANRLDVIVRTGSGNLWHKWWDGSSWPGWEAHGNPGVAVGDPSVVSWQAGRLDVFAVGSDGKLYHQWYPGGWPSSWEGPSGPGVNLSVGAPSVVAWAPNRLDLVAIDVQTCSLWHRWFDGTKWTWESQGAPPGSSLLSDPTMVSWSPNRLDIFAIGTGGRLWHKYYVGGGTWGWEDQGKPAVALAGRPAVVSWAPNRLDVVVRDGTGHVWHNWWNTNPPWGFWEDRGAP